MRQPAPVGRLRIVVAEPSPPIAHALRNFLEERAEVWVVASADEAMREVRERQADVLISSVCAELDGEALVPRLRQQTPGVALILVYAATEVALAAGRAEGVGADGFLVEPLKKHQVLGMVHAVARLSALARQLIQLQSTVAELKKEVRPKSSFNGHDQAFFRKYMLLELKRSKRYQYPAGLLLVSIDKFSELEVKAQQAAVRSEVFAQLCKLVRDIDVAMPFADDKYLLFLPHTPMNGVQVVAGRVVNRLSKLKSFPTGTGSVGVAAFDAKREPQRSPSFGGLVREATACLREAQESGGNRFVARPR